MPWQHRLSRKEFNTQAATAAAGGAETEAAATAAATARAAAAPDASKEGSGHSSCLRGGVSSTGSQSSLQADRSLRVPLERLAGVRTDSTGRPIHSAR